MDIRDLVNDEGASLERCRLHTIWDRPEKYDAGRNSDRRL